MIEASKPLYAMAFFDGQNLYQHAKAAFGHHHPNYDPVKLHAAVCAARGLKPNQVRFYSGVPEHRHSPMWTAYWNNRVLALKRARVHVTTRKLRYHKAETVSPDGNVVEKWIPHEKGIDVRLALDLVKMARRKSFDVAVLFSQDQDLCEVVDEVKEIAREQDRELKICCPFPFGPSATSRRGVDRTDWFRMDRAFYDACLDPHDYRPKKANLA